MDGEDSISFFTIKNALPLQCSESNQGIAPTLVRREDPENGGPAALVARAASSCLFNLNDDHASEWYPHTTDELISEIMEYTVLITRW